MGNLTGAGFAVAVQQVQRRRAERARDILLDELDRGEKTLSVPDVEEVAAVLLRYSRAAHEGAARLNLRLMVNVIAGQAKTHCLYADQFLRYADLIAELRREEVILLGTVHRHWHAVDVEILDHGRRQQATRDRARSELVPTPFRDDDDFYASAEAVTRTALLRTADGVEDDYMLFQPTRLLDELCDLAPLEAAVRREPI